MKYTSLRLSAFLLSPLPTGQLSTPSRPLAFILPLLGFLVDEVHFRSPPEHLFLDPVSLVTWSQNFRPAEFLAVATLVNSDQSSEPSCERR